MLAIKLQGSISLFFFTSIYIYRSTGSSGIHHIFINIKSDIDLADVCCSGGNLSWLRYQAKRSESVPTFFYFFHVWRAQFPCGSFATDVPKRTDLMILVWCGECLIRGTRWKKKWGGSRLTCCWLGRTVRGRKETRAATMAGSRHDAEDSTATSRLEERRQSRRNDPTSRAVVQPKKKEKKRGCVTTDQTTAVVWMLP